MNPIKSTPTSTHESVGSDDGQVSACEEATSSKKGLLRAWPFERGTGSYVVWGDLGCRVSGLGLLSRFRVQRYLHIYIYRFNML